MRLLLLTVIILNLVFTGTCFADTIADISADVSKLKSELMEVKQELTNLNDRFETLGAQYYWVSGNIVDDAGGDSLYIIGAYAPMNAKDNSRKDQIIKILNVNRHLVANGSYNYHANLRFMAHKIVGEEPKYNAFGRYTPWYVFEFDQGASNTLNNIEIRMSELWDREDELKNAIRELESIGSKIYKEKDYTSYHNDYENALFYFNEGQIDKAKALFLKATNGNDDYGKYQSYYQLALMEHKAGNYPEAINYYSYAIGDLPVPPKVKQETKKEKETRIEAQKARKAQIQSCFANTTLAEIYLNRGHLYSRDVNVGAAMKDFKKVHALEPDNAEALWQMWTVYLYHGDSFGAIKIYEKFEKVESNTDRQRNMQPAYDLAKKMVLKPMPFQALQNAKWDWEPK